MKQKKIQSIGRSFRLAAIATLLGAMSSLMIHSAWAGPKGKILVRPLGGTSIKVDGDISDWPLNKFTTIAQQPLFPEGQNSAWTTAQGDHIVFDRTRIGRFNGTTEEAWQAGPTDFGSTIYFAYDSGFLYMLAVCIDDKLRDDRDTSMCSDGTTPAGSSGFFNDGFEFFIDAKGDSTDCASDVAFPSFDTQSPNTDDFQLTVALNASFLPQNAAAGELGAHQSIERGGNADFVGAEKGCSGTFRDVLTVFNKLGARDIAARKYADLRAAGARNPQILANPGTTYPGYSIEMRIPFGHFEGFTPDHNMGFELFWRDVDAIAADPEGKDAGAGGGDISWATWAQSTDVPCSDPKTALFHTANWGELVFAKDNPLTLPHSGGGPKGKIAPLKITTPIVVDANLSDWPLASFTKLARQPLFPESQNSASTTAEGDHIVFERDRVGLFNGTTTKAFQDGTSDFGSSVYFAYDSKFLYLLAVQIDDVYRDERDTTTYGSTGFFNDGFEFFIDARGDSTDCASGLLFPNFDSETPNLDDFQLTVALNSTFKPAGSAADVYGARQTIERAGNPYFVGVAPAEKGGPGGLYRDALDAGNAADGGKDIAAKVYKDLRAAGAKSPEIIANPGTTYTGYVVEMRIPFGKFDGFTPDHSMGFELFWRDVDTDEDVGKGGGNISWATWAQSTDVPCGNDMLALFHTKNWGSLVFGSGGGVELKVNWQASGSTITLTWTDPAAVLEKANKLNGTFAPVSGAASGYQVNTSVGTEAYYRLKK